MIFEPEPGTSIKLNGETINFISLESNGPAATFVYAESGKEGVVYKVLKGQDFYALKVFYPDYRDIRLIENTEKLSRFKTLEGFRVAERTVINHESFPEVVDMYPELNYSVLMPWVEGTGWGNLMITNDQSLQRENYFKIAQTLIRVVLNLEVQGLAHCDLSNNNFIIDQTFSSVQLIDIEDMYAPDMPRPIPDISYGTIGYRTKWIAEQGLWGPESDRFAIAILCSEIITWHNTEIRENKAGDTSFFDEAEIGEDSDRYKIMDRNLEGLSDELQSLFRKAWFSEGSDQCPAISEWMNAIEKIGTSLIPQEEEKDLPHAENLLESPTTINIEGDTIVTSGVPPKMEISQEIFDFGVLHQSGADLEFFISNTGGSVLTGNIIPEAWIDSSPSQFSIEPGEKQAFKISLNSIFPRPKSGYEFRTASALSIDSNAGVEIIGASYKLEKIPFYRRILFRGKDKRLKVEQKSEKKLLDPKKAKRNMSDPSEPSSVYLFYASQKAKETTEELTQAQHEQEATQKRKPTYWLAIIFHVLFGFGLFYVDIKAKRKWLYPGIVLYPILDILLAGSGVEPFTSSFGEFTFFTALAIWALSFIDVIISCRKARKQN
jgi:tRNA A-37 threonylcarbamoyl transferase component Bud32